MNSISPSNVPDAVQVPEGNTNIQVPALPLEIVQVIVCSTVVVPNSRILSLTVPLVISTGAHVAELSSSSVVPLAAVLLSFNAKLSSGNVSPTTRFNVSEYAISSPF